MIIWTKRAILLSLALCFCGIYFIYGGRNIFSIPNLPNEVVLSFNRIGEFLLFLTSVLSIFLISLKTDKKWKMICSNFLYFFSDLFFDYEIEGENRDAEIIEKVDFFIRLAITIVGFFLAIYIINSIPIPKWANYQEINLIYKYLIIGYLFPIIWSSISLMGLYLKEFIQKIPSLI